MGVLIGDSGVTLGQASRLVTVYPNLQKEASTGKSLGEFQVLHEQRLQGKPGAATMALLDP